MVPEEARARFQLRKVHREWIDDRSGRMNGLYDDILAGKGAETFDRVYAFRRGGVPCSHMLWLCMISCRR